MRTVLVAMLVATGLAACSGAGGSEGDGGAQIVVTTGILGDVVEQMVGDAADVEVVMPPDADPHDFAPSARQAAAMRSADALVVNGLGFEEGLTDTIEAAEDDGVTVITATDAIEPLAVDGREDPHVFTDPARLRVAAEHLADELVSEVPALDTAAVDDRVDAYLASLEELDAQVEQILDAVPPERRVLVTNHDVFGYFADRYGFEVLGAIVPGGSTLAEPSAADLDALADAIRARGVPAIFAETSAPARLAEALAAEGTDVEVVELYSESLGEPGAPGGTNVGLVRTNPERIAAARG
jgi:zinc/manganese transport system substrate-binding protein